MHTSLLGAAMLACAIFAQAANAAELPAPMRPILRWNIDYGDTQCTAARSYGDASKPTIFGIVPSPDGQSYALMVSRPRYGPDFATEMPGTVDFGNGPIKAWLLYFGAKGSKASIYQYRISASEMAQARNASQVTLRASGGENFSFSLDLMPVLLDGLEQCTADLRNYWNFGGEKNGTIATPAKGDLRKIFSSDDYPGEAMQNRQEGTTAYVLLIDEKGSVAACQIVKPSGVPVLDAMGCQVIRQRAKFTPARDRNGKAVRSMITSPSVKWQISG